MGKSNKLGSRVTSTFRVSVLSSECMASQLRASCCSVASPSFRGRRQVFRSNERRKRETKKDVHRRVVHYKEGTGVLRSSCCDSSAVRASLSSALTVCDPTKKCFLHPSLIIYFSFIFPTPPIISGTSRGWCAAVFSIPQQCSQYVTLQKMFLTSKFSYLLFFLFFQLHPSFLGLPVDDVELFRASLSSMCSQYVTLQKYFLHPSLIIYFSFLFPTPPIISGTSPSMMWSCFLHCWHSKEDL